MTADPAAQALATRDRAQRLYAADRLPVAAHVRARALWIAATDTAPTDPSRARRLADDAAELVDAYDHTR